MKWIKMVILTIAALMLFGCSSVQKPSSWVFPPMARPLQAPVEQEIQLVRLGQLLQRKDISDDLRAKIYCERGNTYDMLGLRDLARLDFEQSLRFNPAQANVFNMLGVYFTEVGDFDSAYEAFGASLELDPDNRYAIRNQAIALYYGDRLSIALEEVDHFQDYSPDDPFSHIWGYMIQVKLDPTLARQQLEQAFDTYADGEWSWNLVEMMLNKVSDEEMFRRVVKSTRDNEVLAQRLTEIYFYLGKRNEIEHRYAKAISFFKLALSFNVYEFVEHRYAFLELDDIYNKLQEQKGTPES